MAVGSIHLDLDEAARLRHAGEAMALLQAAADRFDALPVLAGDINEQSDQPTWRYLAERLTDCYAIAPRGDGFTFPAGGPHKRIDAIFAVAGFSVVSCGGVDADPADLVAATDHLPVVAELSHPHPGIDERLERVRHEAAEHAGRAGKTVNFTTADRPPRRITSAD